LIFFFQIERAHKVLRMIRGKHWDVTKELTDLKVATEGTEKHRVALRDFIASSVLKPFLMALTLMFFFQERTITTTSLTLNFMLDFHFIQIALGSP
jgi:hypothetical protein